MTSLEESKKVLLKEEEKKCFFRLINLDRMKKKLLFLLLPKQRVEIQSNHENFGYPWCVLTMVLCLELTRKSVACLMSRWANSKILDKVPCYCNFFPALCLLNLVYSLRSLLAKQ